MKLKCKCGKVITKDLYPSKKWDRELVDTEVFDDGYVYKSYDTQKPKGSFEYLHKGWLTDKPQFLINAGDLTLILPEFKEGMGCCNHSCTGVHCECGLKVGHLELDCYQNGCAVLYGENLERIYKK